MSRKVCRYLIVFILVFSLLPWTYAAASNTANSDKAEILSTLGLFVGDSEELRLDEVATRVQGAVMLVRMLGKESAAQGGSYTTPFTDVPEWAQKYVGYMYSNGLTKGVSDTEFGPDEPMTAQQYITFVLRALGYSDSSGDFTFDNAPVKAVEAQVLTANELQTVSESSEINRDNVVLISYKALFAKLKDGTRTLLDKLYRTEGAISAAALKNAAAEDTKVQAYLNAPAEKLTASQISKLVSPAVCYIATYNKSGTLSGSGSGFIVNSEGTVVTAYHVIKNCYSATIKLTSGSTFNVQSVIGYDEKRDIAVLKVIATGLPSVALGDSDTIENGDEVFAIGSPMGLENTITEGLVSNRARQLTDYDGQVYIQTSAAISSGSSGGVLVNDVGAVIGITALTETNAQSVNYAIPINAYKSLSQDKNVTLTDLAASLQASVKTFDQLTDVPIPSGVSYAKKDLSEDGKYVYYYFNESDMDSSAVQTYMDLLSENGWTYSGTAFDSSGNNYACFDKDTETIYLFYYDSYFVVAGSIH